MYGAETWVLSKADELILRRTMDLSVKGQHGDQDIMKNSIVCAMRLIW